MRRIADFLSTKKPKVAVLIDPLGISAQAAGPYLNFKISPNQLFAQTLHQIIEQKENYGSSTFGARKPIVLEYCSPNIAKRLGFQHIRSALS